MSMPTCPLFLDACWRLVFRTHIDMLCFEREWHQNKPSQENKISTIEWQQKVVSDLCEVLCHIGLSSISNHKS
eukprot:4067197-Amphidinium_carterae.1